MMKLSMGHLQALQKKAQSLQQRAENIKKRGDRIVGKVVDAGLVAGTAYGLGVLQGRTGGVSLPGGVSLELALGVAGHGLGLFGIGGNHTHSVANGALAVHFSTVGRGQGKSIVNKLNEKRIANGEAPLGQGVELFGGHAGNKQLPAGAAPGRQAAVVQGEPRRARR